VERKHFTNLRYYQKGFTLGAMFLNDSPLVSTFELPWMGNDRNLSCFPCGIYVAKYVYSPKHGWVYELQDVPGRAEIQLHIGNDQADTLGCVLVGKYHGVVWKGKPWARKSSIGVLDSAIGFKQFMAATGRDKEITIEVIGANDGIK